MPVAEITRSETSERARPLRVDSSAVTLDRTRSPDVFLRPLTVGEAHCRRFGGDKGQAPGFPANIRLP